VGYKIVRDWHKERVGDIISGTWRISPDPISALIKKLGEEYSELAENRDPAELYDIQDVLDELMVQLDPQGKYGEEHDIKVTNVGLFARHVEWQPLPQGDRTWREFMKEKNG
jgi:hypothetical protein